MKQIDRNHENSMLGGDLRVCAIKLKQTKFCVNGMSFIFTLAVIMMELYLPSNASSSWFFGMGSSLGSCSLQLVAH